MFRERDTDTVLVTTGAGGLVLVNRGYVIEKWADKHPDLMATTLIDHRFLLRDRSVNITLYVGQHFQSNSSELSPLREIRITISFVT